MQDTKLCSDCIHSVVIKYAPKKHDCMNPILCENDYVFGGVIPKDCYAERSASGKCGTNGKFFELKTPKVHIPIVGKE